MQNKPTIITVSIQKGGAAKSTTVQAMSEIITSEYEKDVLCIDMDSQANLTTASGIDPGNTEYDIFATLNSECDINDAIISTEYYDIIPASLNLAKADKVLTDPGSEQLLIEKLEDLKRKYQYIIIDTPPALSLLNIMSLIAADEVIVPVEPSRFAIQGLEKLFETIQLIRKRYKDPFNKELKIKGILLVKYKRNTNLNKTVLKNIPKYAQSMGTKVFKTQIRESIRIGECQLLGKPLILETSNAMMDYKDFVDEYMRKK